LALEVYWLKMPDEPALRTVLVKCVNRVRLPFLDTKDSLGQFHCPVVEKAVCRRRLRMQRIRPAKKATTTRRSRGKWKVKLSTVI
jgi:hypothetical protein